MVILPSSVGSAQINDYFKMVHIGIIYLPFSYIANLNSLDHLTRVQAKSKIVHAISRQLIKHWFYNIMECENDRNSLRSEGVLEMDKFDLTLDSVQVIRKLCKNRQCTELNRNLLNMLLESNEKCFIYKGFTYWISYLAFKDQMSDFFDLVSASERQTSLTFLSPRLRV